MTVSELKYLLLVEDLSKERANSGAEGEPGAKMSEISARSSLSRPSVFNAMNRLERNGYITKQKLISLTSAGEKALLEYREIIGWLCRHLTEHCHVPQEIAYADALGCACAFSDSSRENLAEFIRAQKNYAKTV